MDYFPCANCSHSHPIAQAFVDSAMRAVCPACYWALQTTTKAQALPGLSEDGKAFLNAVGAIAFGVFIGKLLVG